MMPSDTRISVVIATYNRRALLERTLPTITKQNLDPALYEVIVVSDGSTDGTIEFLRAFSSRCDLRVIEQLPNQGQAKAANLGARNARGEIVLFLDDDIVCSPTLLRAHLDAHDRQGCSALVFGPCFVSEESPRTLARDWTQQYTQLYTKRLAISGAPTWPYDANVDANSSLPRDVFLESGGFDETFLSARQNEELGTRLWQAGLRFVYEPSADVHQIFVKSNRAVAVADGKAYGRAEIHMLRKLPFARGSSCLATMLFAPRPKRLLHRIIVSLPFSVEPMLRPISAIFQRLRRLNVVCRYGPRILGWRRSIAFHRAAIRELGGLRGAKAEFGTVLPVLMYHHIGPAVPGTFPELTVSPEEFEGHLKLLRRRGYTAIAASDWLAYVQEGRPLPSKPVLLTFDDAYKDLVQYAFPLLVQHGCTGLVFVPTAFIGSSNEWDHLNGSAPHLLMTTEQIAEWAARGIEFGAHTRTHPRLEQLSPEALDEELKGSRRDLEAILERPVTNFAYPYGEFYNDREVEHALRCFSLCFTTDEGSNNLTTDLGRLRRIMIYPDGLLMFRVSIALGLQPIRWLRERVYLRTRLRRLWSVLFGKSTAADARISCTRTRD
jgi:GT2 family glycosyltransferase/peptidoglycan/xylan/chitin deacetylase (PgdA/CDA1 family)